MLLNNGKKEKTRKEKFNAVLNEKLEDWRDRRLFGRLPAGENIPRVFISIF